MKKRLILLVMGLMFVIFTTAYGAGKFPYWAKSSGKQTTSTAVTYSSGFLTAVQIIIPGGLAGGLTVYDGSTEYGTVIYQRDVPAAQFYKPKDWAFPVPFTNGLYVDTSPGTSYIVEYIPR